MALSWSMGTNTGLAENSTSDWHSQGDQEDGGCLAGQGCTRCTATSWCAGTPSFKVYLHSWSSNHHPQLLTPIIVWGYMRHIFPRPSCSHISLSLISEIVPLPTEPHSSFWTCLWWSLYLRCLASWRHKDPNGPDWPLKTWTGSSSCYCCHNVLVWCNCPEPIWAEKGVASVHFLWESAKVWASQAYCWWGTSPCVPSWGRFSLLYPSICFWCLNTHLIESKTRLGMQ